MLGSLGSRARDEREGITKKRFCSTMNRQIRFTISCTSSSRSVKVCPRSSIRSTALLQSSFYDLANLLGRLAWVDSLILDDWGLTPLRDHDSRDLLEVIEVARLEELPGGAGRPRIPEHRSQAQQGENQRLRPVARIGKCFGREK